MPRKGFTIKPIKNKKQKYKQLRIFLHDKRGIRELVSITKYNLRSYVMLKQNEGLQQQSMVSMLKMILAFFSLCEQEENLPENIGKKVELPNIVL